MTDRTLGIDPEKMIEVAKGHEARLNLEIRGDGIITWEGYCHLRDLGAFA